MYCKLSGNMVERVGFETFLKNPLQNNMGKLYCLGEKVKRERFGKFV